MSTTPRTDAFEIKAARDAMLNGIAWRPMVFARTIETELTAAKAERDLAVTRVASILWSGAIDKHTCGDVQKWVEDYTAELAAMTARAEKAEADTARLNWLEKESPEDWGIRSINRDAIDKAMKEASK